MALGWVRLFPWDLADEGVPHALDRLHGEIGVSGVSLWAATPPVLQLRAQRADAAVARSQGGLLFHHEPTHYTATRLKPPTADWAKARQTIGPIAEACAERGMSLRVIISAARTGQLARRHPEVACQNVFGTRSEHSVCLANPDVQAFLIGLVADLSSNHEISAVIVSDFHMAWSEAHAEILRAIVPLDDAARLLLSMCFCQSCRQGVDSAGVDVRAAERWTHTTLRRWLEGQADERATMDTWLDDDSPLAAYARWRATELSSLLQRLVKACKCSLLLGRRLDALHLHQQPDSVLRGAAGVVTRVDGPGELESALCPVSARNELCLPGYLALQRRAPELVHTVARAVELGFAGFEIDDYGMLPDAARTAVKQAVRFGSRSAR